MTPPLAVQIVGAGRAGGSFADALADTGWDIELLHHDDPAVIGVPGGPAPDLVLLCVPDSAVATVASALPVRADTVVAHCAGSLGLDTLEPHPRRGSLHPLVSMPDRRVGATRLRGAWVALAGDPLMGRVAGALGARTITVSDEDRALYHAAAAVASNHLVALMGQVERLAALIGVPLEAFVELAEGSLDNVAEVGPAAALTGPAARGDQATIDAHLEAMPAEERDAYLAMVEMARRLARQRGTGTSS